MFSPYDEGGGKIENFDGVREIIFKSPYLPPVTRVARASLLVKDSKIYNSIYKKIKKYCFTYLLFYKISVKY